jgi:hypothetical protein
MKNQKHPEHQYLDLLRQVLEDGEEQVDSGTGVLELKYVLIFLKDSLY